MKFLRHIFGISEETSKKETPAISWIALRNEDQLHELLSESENRPQLIFKHSTSCGISSMVLNLFTKGQHGFTHGVDMYFLDIHRHRPVSNKIAHKLNIRHESPQLILIRGRKVLVHASHGGIADLHLPDYL